MDYSELLSEVQHRSGVTDVVSRGAHYVRTAERALEKRLKVGAMEATATLTADADGLAPLPADFLQLRSYAAFNVVGSDLVTDVVSGPVEITYYRRIPAIETGANWLSLAEPELYIQAVLFQVYAANGMPEQAAATVQLVDALARAVEEADLRARMNNRRIDLSQVMP